MSLPAANRFHEAVHAGSIVLAFLTQVVSEVFFSLSKVPNALFQGSFRNVSETFPLEVTMDQWSDNNWIVIDLWSKAWLTYGMFGFFKRNVLGPESCNPEVHPPVFYLMWITINLARTSITVLWDREFILAAASVRWILPIYSFYMLYMSYSKLYKYKNWLAVNNPKLILWTRYLTQNGLAAFAWWSLFDASVGLGISLKYIHGVQEPLASSIVLSIIAICIIIWFGLQSILVSKYMRHTFSVYPTLILGLGSMFTSSYRVHDFSANTVVCGVLMILVTIMSFTNLISVCMYTEKPSTSLVVEPYMNITVCETVCPPGGQIKNKVQC
ncbi:uncharacterized protein LOC133423209 [Cololabis saira]|uniref:uncharacterized protein LOC133423209 n=1 Tax=Cololabis saira TaxID=129043 RepID=UPI002AD4BC43|nr:uncharacterized protein LOC133423209 [Cololabis saira]